MENGSYGRLTAIVGAVTAVLAGPAAARADETRITIGVRPAQPQTPIAVEITNTGARHALPSLSLSGNRSGLQLAGYNTSLPRLVLGRLTLAPQYGDHRFAFDFQPSALAGLGLSPRAARGFTLASSGKRGSGTLLIGRIINGPSTNLFGPAAPRVLAFSGTMKPQPTMMISPRLVMPLKRRNAPDGGDPTLGVGIRMEVSRNISVVGDVGSTRTWNQAWAQSAMAGALARWSRVWLEASVSHGGKGVALLGSVPYGALNRRAASARVLLSKGITVDGQLTAFSPVDRPADGTIQRAGTLRIDRLRHGNLLLQIDRSQTPRGTPHSFMVEWRQKHGRGLAVQLLQQRNDGSRSRAGKTRRVQIDVPSLPSPSRRLSLGVRWSAPLFYARPGEARSATLIKGRLAAGARLAFTGEADVQMPGSRPIRRLSRLATGAEIPLDSSSSITIGHVYTPNDSLPPWKRVEVRFTRAISRR